MERVLKLNKEKTPLHELFESIANPDENGYSEIIPIEKLTEIDNRFKMGNGGSWCRDDGALGKRYNIKRIKEKNKIVAVKLDGFNKSPIERKINASILKEIKKRRCVILDTSSQIECDHKNGKYNDNHMKDSKRQKLEDFQALSKAANNAKRQHCKQCKDSNKRYDAKRLGYSQSYIMGDEDSKNCEGCYWHDPYFFNKTISKNFNKKK